MIDKRALLAVLLSEVERDRDALMRRQRDTAAGATHEECRSEHAKDTRATEQSYLARGLAERVEALEQTARVLAGLEPTDFAPSDPVGVTALVRIEEEDGEGSDLPVIWWLLPVAGGRTLGFEGQTLRIVTPAAPLGRALIGLAAGDEASFRSPRGTRHFVVLSVC